MEILIDLLFKLTEKTHREVLVLEKALDATSEDNPLLRDRKAKRDVLFTLIRDAGLENEFIAYTERTN